MSEQGLTGQTLGPYEIGPLLGRGACATVYRARRTTGGAAPDGAVALKVFNPDVVTDERTFQRLEREADLGLRIRHPHLVPTYDCDAAEHEGRTLHYMAMELVEGETLRDVIADLRIVPEDLLYQIADQVLDALSAVHAEGMIHRDVKPENIILTRDQQVRVMDLGVARLQQQGRDLTLDGEFVGSLAYASPEQFTDQDNVDPRTDIYAVGVLLYEMATGVNPYDDGDLMRLIELKLRSRVRRPRILNRNLDPFLDDVIQTCLEKDPDDRFATCDALRDVLREREDGAWWHERIAGESFPAAARALRRLRGSRDAPLVGREAEMAGLHEALERVKRGTGGTMLVSGPAGIGKSRLLHDFLEDLMAPDGPLLLAGPCPEEAVQVHHPFREALQGYLGAEPDVPGDDLPAYFKTFLADRAKERPVVLVIEDVQHASEASLALLEALTHAIENLPILLVVTWRSDEVEAGSALHTFLTNTAARPRAGSIPLAPLEREGIEDFLTALVKQPRTVRALSWPLTRASGGNPSVLLEVVRHLQTSGALSEVDGAWHPTGPIRHVGLPDSVRVLLLLRLVDLDPEQMQLLEAAAAQGPTFDVALLATVTGQKRLRLLKRLAVLERKHGVLASEGRGTLRFASHGLWQVIHEGMRAERREECHALCADAIAATGEPLDGAEAYAWARHTLTSGRRLRRTAGLEEAIRFAATQVHAVRGVSFLERLAEMLDEHDASLQSDVRLHIAHLHALLGHAAEARHALEQAAEAAARAGAPELRSRVANELAASSLTAGDHAQAEAEAEDARVLAEEADDRAVQARAQHTAGVVAASAGALDRGARLLRAAAALRQELDDQRGIAETSLALARIHEELGEREDARGLREAALDGFREAHDRRGEAAALNAIGDAWTDAGRPEPALACYEQALEIVRELGDLPAEAATLHDVARLHLDEARIERACADLEQALDMYRQLGHVAGEAVVLGDLGAALGAFGDHDAALDHLEQARTLAAAAGDRSVLPRVLHQTANVKYAAGETEAAWRDYDAARELWPTGGRAVLLTDMGQAALREGDPDRATRLLEESVPLAQGTARHLVALCRLARAQLQGGRAAEARTAAEQVVSLLDDEAPLPPHFGPEIFYTLAGILEEDEYLLRANELLGARLRAIENAAYREHYLAATWPAHDIFEQVRALRS